jgi:photoactive yellow protein
MSPTARPATTRQTLPAPGASEGSGLSSSNAVESLLAEGERLRHENDVLLARIEAQEASVRDAALVIEEVVRLRREVAQLRTRATRTSDVAPVRLPPPSPLPRELGAPLFSPAELPTGSPRQTDHAPSTGIDFGTVSRLTPAELDTLPYGLICLDAQGRVVHYNDTESRMARLPKESVIGRSFFQEVAPCTRVREFEGQFYDLVRDPSGVRVRSFDFVFRFRHSEQHVTIVLTPARQRGLYNMALLRRSVTPA